MTKIFASLMSLLLAGLTTAAIASDDFGLSPAACEDAVADYMSTRLTNPRAAQYRLTSDPYQVMVSMRGGSELQAWAVDVRVKSRLATGSWSGFQEYTVIFQDGAAVALEDDLSDVSPV